MFLKRFLFLFPIILFSREMVWDNKYGDVVSDEKYNKVLHQYIELTYPKKVQAFKIKKQKEEALKIKRELKEHKIKEAEIAKQRRTNIKKYTLTSNGLMWQDNREAKYTKRSWSGALNYCGGLDLFGFSDWRLPDKIELKNIIENKKFKNSNNATYWSSSIFPFDWSGRPSNNFSTCIDSSGFSQGVNKKSILYIRCVRDL